MAVVTAQKRAVSFSSKRLTNLVKLVDSELSIMAEFVQQSIEEMLPELEQMERVGLFSTGETR